MEIDLSEIEPDTMTDCGLPVSEIEPIEGCSLTPGNPSPVGRAPWGDLAYPVLETHTWAHFTRDEMALLAHLLHRAIPQAESDPSHPAHRLQRRLIEEAAPRVLLASPEDSAHGTIATLKACAEARKSILEEATTPLMPAPNWFVKET